MEIIVWNLSTHAFFLSSRAQGKTVVSFINVFKGLWRGSICSSCFIQMSPFICIITVIRPWAGERDHLMMVLLQTLIDLFPQVSFNLSEDLTVVECSGEKVSSVRSPREHPFTMQTVGGQSLAVFTESSGQYNDGL